MSGAAGDQGQLVAAPRFLVAGLITLTMVTGVVGSLGAPLVPEIAASEGVSLATAQWSLTATLFVGALSPPIIGRLGAGSKRRRVMLVCLALVCLGTLLAALQLGFGGLVTGRALQGLGFGTVPLALAVARDQLPDDLSRKTLANISLANVISAGLGFPIAAALADLIGVKGAFWVAFGFTLVALIVAMKVMVPGPDEGPRRTDLIGAALLGAATFGVLLAISRAEDWGYTSTRLIVVIAVSVVLLIACVAWLLRVPQPLVDLRLAALPGVLGAHAAAGLAGIGMYLTMATVMVLVQAEQVADGLDKSVFWAGLMLTPYAVASIAGSRVALRLGPVIGPDLLLPVGALLFAASNAMLAMWHDSLWQVALAMVTAGLGSGCTFNSIPWLLVRVVPAAETSSAMALNMVVRMLGFSIGSALSVAVLAHFAEEGHTTHAGFVGAGVLGVGFSLLAAGVCAFQARTARRALA